MIVVFQMFAIVMDYTYLPVDHMQNLIELMDPRGTCYAKQEPNLCKFKNSHNRDSLKHILSSSLMKLDVYLEN